MVCRRYGRHGGGQADSTKEKHVLIGHRARYVTKLRVYTYIKHQAHSLSSGKFIRANIRDAVKVTLFNVHPPRETARTHTTRSRFPPSVACKMRTSYFFLLRIITGR